jgi:penicillin-binding protein 1C
MIDGNATAPPYGRMRRKLILAGLTLLACFSMLFVWKTTSDLRPFPDRLTPGDSEILKAQILDRNGIPLSVTYANQWNIHDHVPLHQIPTLLQQAFIASEDKRFYKHGGVDWKARLHAVLQNLRALRVVRGASTITEQVVRMLHPRPRSIWSRWIEGIEAVQLEKRFTKPEILELYLNQVPYARQRRGVVQAARLYFNRDLNTLSVREMLALAVLVRAPATLDLYRAPRALNRSIAQLASIMRRNHLITEDQYHNSLKAEWSLAKFKLPTDAAHFVTYVQGSHIPGALHSNGKLKTTLDSSLQSKVQQILDSRLADLHSSQVADGAVLVLDHQTDEILAWVNGGGMSTEKPGGWIDAVTAPRQPGSTLKPFVYALALDRGWTPSTIIDDSPLSEAVRSGLHSFQNYSRRHYGPLRLRDALGNSLNIPAVHAIQFTGVDLFLEKLHELGIKSLNRPPEHYGEGLVLGNGEVSLLELVRAYAVLARRGHFRPLRFIAAKDSGSEPFRRVFSEEAASLIADILSDPYARRMEFGNGHLLRLPVQTAVKTGTSNDHRDAWVVGFSHRHTVGVWMGNLDRTPTRGITGTTGPALVLRAVFTELNRYLDSKPLSLSSNLISLEICRSSGLLASRNCPPLREWFIPGRLPKNPCPLHPDDDKRSAGNLVSESNSRLFLLQPTPNLQLVMDPRIPDELEAFTFLIPRQKQTTRIEWMVNGELVGTTKSGEHQFLWPLSRGTHTALARVWQEGIAHPVDTPPVRFSVR